MKVLGLIALVCTACGGTTGSALVKFTTQASGPADATGGSLKFTSGYGAQVTLTKAKLHIGAVYLNQSVPTSGAAAEPCISPGIYVAQEFGPADIDLLSASPVTFPTAADGTQTEAKTAEVWLTGGDVNATDDSTVILAVAGTAVQAGQSYPFSGSVTIGANRKPTVSSPALPGANPICHQRVVTPIAVALTPTNGGILSLKIDPRPMFNAVDFSTMTQAGGSPPSYQIPDTTAGAGGALFKGLVANSGVYNFTWNGR